VPVLRDLLDQWRRDLAAWAIPEEITSAVEESPWVLPRGVFVRRARRHRDAPGGPSFERAWQALEPPGTVLDVGSGAGAACLPLAPRTTGLTAVDVDTELLDTLVREAAGLDVPTRPVVGRWPDVAGGVESADVVTCHHVLYNVPDLEPFVAALTARARRLVVVELTARHPLTALNPLWLQFHGLARPEGPTARDAVAILRAMGLEVEHEEWTRPAAAEYATFDELVDIARRRLCLPPERAPEVADALRDVSGSLPDLGSSGRDLVTVWWTPT
jgi:SAM-dependent methyltransferase